MPYSLRAAHQATSLHTVLRLDDGAECPGVREQEHPVFGTRKPFRTQRDEVSATLRAAPGGRLASSRALGMGPSNVFVPRVHSQSSGRIASSLAASLGPRQVREGNRLRFRTERSGSLLKVTRPQAGSLCRVPCPAVAGPYSRIRHRQPTIREWISSLARPSPWRAGQLMPCFSAADRTCPVRAPYRGWALAASARAVARGPSAERRRHFAWPGYLA